MAHDRDESPPRKPYPVGGKQGEPGILNFREDPHNVVFILMLAFALILIWLARWLRLSETWSYSGMIGALLLTFAGLTTIAVLIVRMTHEQIQGGTIHVGHPWLGARWQKSFRSGDLASVELKRAGRGYEVLMRLHDGRVMRYFTCDEKKAEGLLAALKSAMATAKPSPVADDELA